MADDVVPPVTADRTEPFTVRVAESRLDSVVVYASGALCRRRARFRVPPGAGRVAVRFTGLPLALDPHSLRGLISSGAPGWRVLDARREVEVELPDPADLSPLHRDCEAADGAEDAARAARAALAVQVEHIAALRAVPPQPRRGDPPRHAPTEALLALAEFVGARLDELQQRLLAAEDAEREAERSAELARRRLQEASGALPTDGIEPRSTVLLTLGQDLGSEPGLDPEPQREPESEPEAGPGPSAAPDTGAGAGLGVGSGAAEVGPELELELEYGVPGATWAPTYQVRVEGIHGDAPGGSLVMRASVAQRTGEDWTGVRLGLSTADLHRRTDLPELRSLRIGRRQAAPAPLPWREPPVGLSELFTGYDAFRGSALAPLGHSAGPAGAMAGGASVRRGAGGYGGPVPLPPAFPPPVAPGGRPEPLPAPVAAVPPRPVARSARLKSTAPSVAASAAFAAPADAAKSAVAAAPVLRDYAELVLAGADAPEPERGLLHPASEAPDAPAAGFGGIVAERRRSAEAIARLELPPRCLPVRLSAGSFDHRYDTAAPVDVAADGGWHTVPVLEFPVDLTPEHVCVPAVDTRVHAAVRLGNTSGHALLAGGAEVSVDGAYLRTVQLPTLAPGEQRSIGIGVVESVQVARHTRMRESPAGLRGGTTVLAHTVEIDLANRLGRPVTVEVRERVPVGGDKDVKVEEQPSTPPWTVVPPEEDEQHRRGMRVWRVTLEPHAERRLSAGYEIRIPAAKAVVDGNRRR